MGAKRASTTSLVKLLQSADCPICIFDAARRIIFANAALCELAGCAESDLLLQVASYSSEPTGQTPADIANALCPPPHAMEGAACSVVVSLPSGNTSGQEGAATPQQVRANYRPLNNPADNEPGGSDEPSSVIAFFSRLDSKEALKATTAPASEVAHPEWAGFHTALQQLRQETTRHAKSFPLHGTSPAVTKVQRQALMLAATATAATIIAPAGAPRKQLAEFLHAATPKQIRGSFLAVDCKALSWEQLQENVFSFLAAGDRTSDDQIDTILIDSLDALSTETQQPAAQFIARLADEVRVLASAEQSLAFLSEHGEFPQQLASQLSTAELLIPPLAERREDIPLTAQAIVERLNANRQKQIAGFQPQAMDELCLASWPGDEAQLALAIASAFENANQPLIDIDDLPESIRREVQAASDPAFSEPTTIDLEAYLAEIESTLIRRALDHAKGNKTQAAKLLGMTRPRLYRRLEQLGWNLDEDES